jgi:transcriptional regulator with XRE-family HTH domain
MDTAWFRGLLRSRQMSQRGLAKMMGLDAAAVSLMLRGQRRMTLEEARAIASLLGTQVTEVLRRAGVDVRDDVSRVKIVASVDNDGAMTLFPEGTHDTVDGPADCPAGTYAVQVRAPGQAQDGWIVYIGPGQYQANEMLDRLSLSTVAQGSQVLSVIRRGYRTGRHNLIVWPSRAIHHDQDVVWAAPVLWIRPG